MTLPSGAVVKLYVFDNGVVVSEELVYKQSIPVDCTGVASRFEAEAATSALEMVILIVISQTI